eukprot:4938963-Pleurochrysis_carterae.AAC.1
MKPVCVCAAGPNGRELAVLGALRVWSGAPAPGRQACRRLAGSGSGRARTARASPIAARPAGRAARRRRLRRWRAGSTS